MSAIVLVYNFQLVAKFLTKMPHITFGHTNVKQARTKGKGQPDKNNPCKIPLTKQTLKSDIFLSCKILFFYQTEKQCFKVDTQI